MPESVKPTVVLVHGAFADASGFAGIITELSASDYRVLARDGRRGRQRH
jgi:alpha-beta hydrolase superfamily lysophospholipase